MHCARTGERAGSRGCVVQSLQTALFEDSPASPLTLFAAHAEWPCEPWTVAMETYDEVWRGGQQLWYVKWRW